jgi:hypothetical protein
MANQLIAAYGHGRAVPVDLLIIEQLDWMPYVGGLSRFAMVSYLAGLIYDNEKYKPFYDCGIQDGRYLTVLYVYPLRPGLNYRLRVTHGKLGERREEAAKMQETIKVKLNRTIDLKYPATDIVSMAWQGACHNAQLSVVPPPTLRVSADRRHILVDAEVYGTVNLTTLAERHVYTLAVSKRTEAVENHYSSVAYGVYDGGPPEILIIKPPPGAEELDGECGQGGGTIIGAPDDEPPNWPDPHADRTTVYNWCDPHELISDTVTGV